MAKPRFLTRCVKEALCYFCAGNCNCLRLTCKAGVVSHWSRNWLKRGVNIPHSRTIEICAFGENKATKRVGSGPWECYSPSVNTLPTIAYSFFQTSLGRVLIAFKGRRLVFLHFGASRGTLLSTLKATFPLSHFRVTRSTSSLSKKFQAVLEGRGNFSELHTRHLDLVGTPFQISVWRFLQTIPPGTTVSYSDVARGIGSPNAARAAASACAKNDIAVLIPCHRVTPSNGKAGRYRWGSWRKRALLRLEDVTMKTPDKPTTSS